MKFAVCIIKPSDYPHSAAFQEVAESIHYGLTELGHDFILITDGFAIRQERTQANYLQAILSLNPCN